MFTGLIEDIGTLLERTPHGRSAKLSVRTAIPLAEVSIGDSIAVNGACLTVESTAGAVLAFHCLNETLARTNLASLPPGAPVNLERALRLGDRLGGHLVAGHVDATAAILDIRHRDDDIEVAVASPEALQALLIPKGSVALNGISLTIAALEAKSFRLRIIPHTWRHTNLRAARPGDCVNVEGDMVGKFILRQEQVRRGGSAVTYGTLGQAGFL